jgi:hypothetical protein
MSTTSRRHLLAQLPIGPLAAVGGISALSSPAQAGVGWGQGPNSGLPFWLGAYAEVASIQALMRPSRSPDLVGEFEGVGTYLDVATKQPPYWPKLTWYRDYLLTGRASAFQWTGSPFCSGPNFVIPKSWPSSAAAVNGGYHLNCCCPPTFTGQEDATERTAKQRRCWEIAVNGWLDPVWREKMMIFKRNYFVKHGLRNLRIVLRACWELNTSTKWGNRSDRRAYGMMELKTVGDYQIVREAIRRYFAVFLDVFGNSWASIPGDFAYPDNQLWPYWNTNKDHKGPVDVRLTCPSNAKLVGPDFYDHWPAHLSDAIWNDAMMKTSKQGWPVGLYRWLEWARAIGKPLALGEVGLSSKQFGSDGGRPPHEGWDNPAYVRLLLAFCKTFAGDIAFISYFNRDNVSSTALPAHLIKPWAGMDNGVACARNPPGDNHRCGALAFKQWMAANG